MLPASATEDGRNYRPKHVQLIEIINKLLLLHLIGCLHNYGFLFSVRNRIKFKLFVYGRFYFPSETSADCGRTQ